MRLPRARGDLSATVIDHLGRRPGTGRRIEASAGPRTHPYGDDLQLALYLCYELHYRGFDGVDANWEWDPELLRLRHSLERRFLEALRDDVPRHPDLSTALEDLLTVPVGGTGVSRFLRDEGETWQLREYAALRSLYHLKEADPHVWVIPRIRNRAKAGMMAVEYDEFGAGRADRVHARLFARLMEDLGIDSSYGRYLEAATAETLATVNLMSLLGLHRSLRGALVGHFATVEITSSPASRRLADAMTRLNAGPAAVHFYTEHVEADAVHEQLVRHEVIDGLLEDEPHLASDVLFGIDATVWLEGRLEDRLLDAWQTGGSATRESVRP
ncbi:iron-containing redox enzyme family protein [Streptomyces meridianus]|uniref:Iron-containing redox enzyme family protein n=1 Tax=Streptomyces meridianus TaxID=2938945 RepID=A0ABT0XAR0_9ACTN|nr:iron-containing redox enzyme family protein [Streptomyces meridianus]MCM2579616.1 iron-containing redox enzyme family protein [Streptomyces meridianus]